jgi:putative peptidoglycan lipid II flippase
MSRMADSTKLIFSSAKRFFSGTLISRVSGLARDIAMAYAFGTGAAVAGFLVAFRFAHLLRRLFGEGAMQAAFVPLFEHIRHENPQKAAFFFRDLQRAIFLILVGVTIIGGGVLWALYASQFFSPVNNQIVLLTLLMLPSLIFICLFGLNASVLQCDKKFFLPAVAPVAFNIVWIACALLLIPLPEDKAMNWLAIGIIFASMAQWAVTAFQTKNIITTCGGKGLHWFETNPFGNDLARIWQPLVLGVLGVAASQINNFLDAIFARYASLEGPAYLWYAVRLQQLPLALFGIALSGALLPPLSRAYKAGDQKTYLEFLFYSLQKTTLLLLPLSFMLWMMASSGISVAYGRGDFDAMSIAGTAKCLWMYAVGLLPMGLVQVFAPAFYARQNYYIPMQASVASMATNVLLNTLFVMGLGWDAASIALATSISAWVNAIILGFCLWQREPRGAWRAWLGNTTKILSITVTASVILALASPIVLESAFNQATHFEASSWMNRVLEMCKQAVVFGGVFLGGYVLLRRFRKD